MPHTGQGRGEILMEGAKEGLVTGSGEGGKMAALQPCSLGVAEHTPLTPSPEHVCMLVWMTPASSEK